MNPSYYSRSLEGHRAAYLDFVKHRFGGERVNMRGVFLHPGPIMFLMIEENFGLYCLASMFRSLLGRRTVGLLFRPLPAIEGRTYRLRFKRLLLKCLKHLPYVKTLSIVPTPLRPQIQMITNDWIYDFQLWDLDDVQRTRYQNLKKALKNEHGDSSDKAIAIRSIAKNFANGRPLLIALGVQNKAKGAELLAMSMRKGGCNGWAVLVAGRFAPECIGTKNEIEACGGKVINRVLSDEEMLALYASADAIWCLYDPSYDQASGILGRAVQLGVPPVVRKGSLSEALCKAQGIPHLSAKEGIDLNAALSNVNVPPIDAGLAICQKLAGTSIRKILSAMGAPQEFVV